MVRRFMSSGGAGYALVHLSSAICVAPALRAACTASSISPSVAMPVEISSGLPVRAICSISGMSVISGEATLSQARPSPPGIQRP